MLTQAQLREIFIKHYIFNYSNYQLSREYGYSRASFYSFYRKMDKMTKIKYIGYKRIFLKFILKILNNRRLRREKLIQDINNSYNSEEREKLRTLLIQSL